MKNDIVCAKVKLEPPFNQLHLNLDSGFPGFHLGSTYSGTFHTDGGGVEGSPSLPSDCERCLERNCACVANTGEAGTLGGDLGIVEDSSFLASFTVLTIL